jgi:hypothetical protein
MKKRAQGFSLNVIVIMAIALIVLIVLVAVFAGKSKRFASSTESCEDKRGVCVATTAECDGPTFRIAGCGEETPVCCIAGGA